MREKTSRGWSPSLLTVLQVIIGPPQRYTWPAQARPVKSRQQADEELAAFVASGSAAAAAACAGDGAGQGFLLSQPPLPLELLSRLDTASMLALPSVCRQLRCTSYELLRREEAAMRKMNSYLGSSTYVPLQLHGSAIEGGRKLSTADRRYMRCISLLCGTPEQAAERCMQYKRDQKASWDSTVCAEAAEEQACC